MVFSTVVLVNRPTTSSDMSRTRILLTGADSLIGSHIHHLLLPQQSYSLRAVVKSKEQAAILQQEYRRVSASCDVVVIPEQDDSRSGMYDHILHDEAEPFHVILHTSFGSSTDGVDCLARFINLESDSLINFLESIQHLASQVARVVLVTSLTPFAKWLAEDAHQNRARGIQTSMDAEYILAASSAGNNIVHNTVLQWLQRNQPRFDFVYITVPSCYGPATRALQTSSDVLEANRRIWNICNNEHRKDIQRIPYGLAPYADVRVCLLHLVYQATELTGNNQDVANACIQSVSNRRARNKRFMVSGGIMPSDYKIAAFINSQFPELYNRLAYEEPQPHEIIAEEFSPDVEIASTMEILDLPAYRPIEETIVDTARQMLDLQQRKEWRRIIRS